MKEGTPKKNVFMPYRFNQAYKSGAPHIIAGPYSFFFKAITKKKKKRKKQMEETKKFIPFGSRSAETSNCRNEKGARYPPHSFGYVVKLGLDLNTLTGVY